MDILKEIKKHEGFKSKVYKCTEGYDTIGYGFAIKDLEMDEDVAELILMKKIKKLLERIIKTFSWFKDSPKEIQYVVTNMCYQLGLKGFSKFKKTIYLLETEQYDEASVEMLDSLWAKQTPNRAKELSEVVASVSSN
ncbi:MAG: putative endolysin [Prokaryotic dsDNA virus sp.]|nr:MAG: putative endolysin [Prokaryotic dsDNA virus sp.]|tara:strand:+ start:1044 stop:1454 length:411 start_codon:yes stop_codon:yes gene_type:complete